MVKKKANDDLKLEAFPEEITENGVRIYGETSYENQMAVLSHYLHNEGSDESEERKTEIISAVREFLSRKQFRQCIDKDEMSDEEVWRVAEDATQYDLFADFFKVPFPAPQHPKFTFIDLFAGIGGFRIAFQNLGGKCVYSSEFDAKAQESYLANYGEMPFGDITKESTKKYIPQDFDILCGGFPCQAFSLAGRRLGFKDETRGTLFFEIERLLERYRPKAFLLENVRGLYTHDEGRTFNTIMEKLHRLGYGTYDLLQNSSNFGVPQNRVRLYIVGILGHTPAMNLATNLGSADSHKYKQNTGS